MTAFNLRAVQVHLVENFDDARDFQRWLARDAESCLGVDIESTGLNAWDVGAAIRLVQFGDTRQGWAIPYEQWRGMVLEVLNTWPGEFILHNLAFEARWFAVHGDGYRFPLERTHDTMIAAQVIDPSKSAALKPLADTHLDRRASAGQHALKVAMDKYKWGWADIPVNFPDYWTYGALDPVLTVALHHKFQPLVGPGGRFSQIYDLEMATRHIVSDMEIRGARVDLEYSEQQADRLDKVHDEMIEWGEATYGINLASTKRLGWLIEELGGVIAARTYTGLPKVDKDQLQFLINDQSKPELSTLAQNVLDMRQSGKTAEAYFRNFLLYADSDAIIHPEVRTMGARTGRMSVGNPALQQVPKGSALVRNAFIPREGNALISTDFSQIEMRLMAHFSDDAGLIETFREADATGGDFFVAMGAAIYGDPTFSKKDPRRSLVKNVMYGKAYGAGVAKMASSAGVPLEQMQVVAEGIDSQYPGLRRMMKKVEGLGADRARYEGQGYVTTPYGRRLPCDDEKTYTLVNYLLQGHAAEVFKKSLIDLDAAGFGPYFLLPIHDEILVDMPIDLVADAMHEIPEVMKNTTDYKVDILAESEGPLDRWQK
jgi:DNA polymerase-1